MSGDKLIHNQINQADSQFLAISPLAICTVIGEAIGLAIGGPYGAIIGPLVGFFLGAIVSVYVTGQFTDEWGCIWWWISRVFVEWLFNNARFIYNIFWCSPSAAVSMIMAFFLRFGYLRIGQITFYDAIGAGSPGPGAGEPEPV